VASLPISACCLIGYGVQLCSGRYIPGYIFSPGPTRYLGSIVFLTVQTNVIGVLYFSLCMISSPLGSASLDSLLMRLFPLVFALGIFLTAAYYGLEYTNPNNKQAKRALTAQGYRYVYLSSHLEHGFAGPLTLLFAASVRLQLLQPGVGPPAAEDANLYVGGFLLYYFALTLANRKATGCWVYPIFNDVSDAGGSLALGVFMAAVMLLSVCLGHAGISLLHYANHR